MTSPANTQSTSAPISTTNTATTSYASAAGANKPAAATPVIVASSSPAIAGGSTPVHHAQGSSPAPMNGKPQITPAVPAVARGSVNGGADHSRKPSVTMNGAPMGAPKPPVQFGFQQDSPPNASHNPAVSGASLPMRVPSPAHAPEPIPLSGGRPPQMQQDGQGMKFGSLPGDADRHMKHLSNVSQSSLGGHSPHARHDSTHSVHTDMPHHGGPNNMNRGGYPAQGGRGRGGNMNHTPQFSTPSMSYSNTFPRGPANQGGRGMPQQFGRQPPFAGSPQIPRASPSLANAMPGNTTPHMPPAMPVAPGPQAFNQFGGFPQQGGFPPPQPGFPYMHNTGYTPMNAAYPMYPQTQQFMPQSGSPGPTFPGPYPQAGGYAPPPQATHHAMSRNGSQISAERPSSSTGQIQAPVIVNSGAPPPNAAQKSSFSRPKTSKISIKNDKGEEVSFKTLKTPASPAPSVQPSKTPPVVASTPTPPPKPATPAQHTRTESIAAQKPAMTKEQIVSQFKEEVAASVKSPEDLKADVGSETKSDGGKSAEPPQEGTVANAEVPKTDAKAVEPTVISEQKPTVEDPKEAVTDKATEAPAKDNAAVDEEEDIERMIREMEEAEAAREAKEAAFLEEKKARDAEAKKQAEAQRLANAAEEDRKLKEAEAEMERLEEERERKRAEGGGQMSVEEALGKTITDLKGSDKEPASPGTADAVAAKLGDLKITDTVESPKTSADGRRPKPSALNLAPLNTKSVEPPQPSAAIISLKTARMLLPNETVLYPSGIASPNPAINEKATSKKYSYNISFLLQFKGVFTDPPSENFDKQVKNLLGDGDPRSAVRSTPSAGGGRQNSRNAPPAGGFGGAMGSFGTTKPLPPGTTSEQRFAMSSGSMSRPPNLGGMAFGRAGGFPGSNQMSRTPSSTNMMPNSPRQGSRTTRGGSKRDNYQSQKAEAAAKTMPLTQGQEIKTLVTSTTGWKPMSLTRNNTNSVAAAQPGMMDPETVQRKVKAALNKMTPEKFDKIADSILAIAMQSKDEEDGRTLRQVIQLTFEKATDEAHWAPMYAKFCRRMLETMSPDIRDTTILDKNGKVVSGGALFRKYLLNRCQEEFEKGWKVNLPKPKEGESKETVMLSDDYYVAMAAKRRGLGLVQFIGELYKLGMLTERIMHECVRKLVDYDGAIPDEAEVESLVKLLRTIGANLDSNERLEKGKGMMDAYFGRIGDMIKLPDLPSRLQFMLMDIVDLRKRNWVSNEADKGPKTLEQVKKDAEAAAAAKAAESARGSQRGGQGGRPNAGRGDARYPSYNQPAPNQVGMDDLRRLKGTATRTTSSNIMLGPTSMLMSSRSNSGRRMGPGGAFGRAGEESGASSRTGTPPTREPASSANAFAVLANAETENPTSPPSTAASPALSKAVPDTGGKKESD